MCEPSLGNDVAIEAYRTAQSFPFPDGSVIARLAWSYVPSESEPAKSSAKPN